MGLTARIELTGLLDAAQRTLAAIGAPHWPAWLESDVGIAIRVAIIAFVGLLVARTASRATGAIVGRSGTPQQVFLTRRVVFYALVFVTLMIALDQLELDLTVLLGTAGILTVAVGFASQTSASNVISGLFLLGEQPFVVGDYVQIGATEGEVLSIDWLSVKLRTFDNLYVRVPNETLIKSEIVNLTRFPIRRFVVEVELEHEADLARAETVLLQTAEQTPDLLASPVPAFRVTAIRRSGVVVRLIGWAEREDFYAVRSLATANAVTALVDAGVPLAHPPIAEVP